MKNLFTAYFQVATGSKSINYLIVSIALLFISLQAQAQVGIGTITPDASAQLDVSSTSKGVLIPRMSKAERDLIPAPATGLLIFQTNETPGFYYYDGTGWQLVGNNPVVGFSANLYYTSVSASATLTNYSVSYGAPGFNSSTGQYTVPETGKYVISAVINYKLRAAATGNLLPLADPYFHVQKTTPYSTSLLVGLLPVINVNVALVLTLRTILGNGAVTLSGNVLLSAGDVIHLGYVASGLTEILDIGGPGIPGVAWSVTKL